MAADDSKRAGSSTQPAVVVSIGPLAGSRSRRGAQRRRRLIGKVLCGSASVCFVAGQLVLQRSLGDMPEERHGAPPLGSSRLAGQAGAVSTIRPGAEGGADLDELYPPHDAWVDSIWSGSGVAAPWLDGIRDSWLRSLGIRAGGALPPVPHTIHQTWKDAFPPRELFSPRWRASLQHSNTGWGYRLWTDAENLQLVRSNYPELIAAYEGYPSPIQRADAARYVIAHHFGGFYFDLDYECFHPLTPLLRGASLLLSYKSGSNFSKGASNSVFGSAARHPLWPVVFDVLLNRSRTPLLGHTAVLFSTGPAVLREALRRLLRLPAGQQISPPMLIRLREALGILVLDSALLHPLTAEQRDLAKHPLIAEHGDLARKEPVAGSKARVGRGQERQGDKARGGREGWPRDAGEREQGGDKRQGEMPSSAEGGEVHKLTAIQHSRRAEGEGTDAQQQTPSAYAAVCRHHFVSSWVAHDSVQHADTERRRREGHRNAAVEGAGLAVRQENAW